MVAMEYVIKSTVMFFFAMIMSAAYFPKTVVCMCGECY